MLAMYHLGDTCHLILDVPGGCSGRFATDQSEIASVNDYRLAAENKRPLACPDALRKSLRSLKLSRGQKLWVHYHDPVLGIGDLRAGHLVLKPVSQQPAPPTGSAAPDFPFDVRSSLADPFCELGILRAVDEWQPTSPPRPGLESKVERVRRRSDPHETLPGGTHPVTGDDWLASLRIATTESTAVEIDHENRS